jgi:hypothetical protein
MWMDGNNTKVELEEIVDGSGQQGQVARSRFAVGDNPFHLDSDPAHSLHGAILPCIGADGEGSSPIGGTAEEADSILTVEQVGSNLDVATVDSILGGGVLAGRDSAVHHSLRTAPAHSVYIEGRAQVVVPATSIPQPHRSLENQCRNILGKHFEFFWRGPLRRRPFAWAHHVEFQ